MGAVVLLAAHHGKDTMLLRNLTEQDAVAAAELENSIFPEESFNERTITNILSDRGIGWGYFSAVGNLLGYSFGRVSLEGLLDILRIGVVPSARNSTIGTALLLEALSHHPNAMLTVRKQNTGALRFYRRHGFKIVGELEIGPSWVMRTTSSG